MRLFATARHVWRGLRHRRRVERDLDDELRLYYDALVDRHVRQGLEPAAAQRAARLEMGGMQQVKEQTRDAWLAAALDAAGQDARTAWRALRKSPAVSAAVVLTFAIGIAGATAIFSVVNALLLTPMPYRDPGRLVFVRADLAEAAYPRAPLSGPELNDLRERARLFDGFAAVWSNSATLTDGDEPEQLRLGLVSTNFFPLLGVGTAAGRLFEPADAVQGGPQRTILLSWALWQRRYGGDPSIVGRRVLVNDQPAAVVGVLPESFRLLLPPGSGVPDDLDAYQLFNPAFTRGPRGQQFLRVVGRMREGVAAGDAREEVASIGRQISGEFAEYAPSGRRFEAVALGEENVREVRQPLLLVLAGVALLLLIAAVNAATLLVARAVARRPETALRVALGAGAARIVRAALVEGLTLAALGTAVGLLLAHAAVRLLIAARPDALNRLQDAPIDGRVLATACGVALLWGVLFGLAPAAEVLRRDVSRSLAIRGDTERLRHGTRWTLVVVQIAVTLVLLIGAGLTARTFVNIEAIDPGFRAGGVLTFRVAASTPRTRTREAANALARRVDQALRAIPSVTGAASVSHLPYDNIPNWFGPYSTVEAPDQTPPHADYRAVGPGFFATAGVSVIEGRVFTEDDELGRQPVAIVDDMLARRAWPHASPLGQALWADPGSTGKPVVKVTVVGVVRHVRYRSLVDPLNEQVFFPLRQVFRNPVAYIIRTTGDPAALTPAVRQAVSGVDARLPIFDAQPLSDYVARARGVQRFTMLLVASFGAVAVVLAAVGIYGVMAYAVVRRRREFGVRLALGARRTHIVALVLGEGARLTAVGLAAGVVVAAAAARALRAQLFGVTSSDPATYLAAAVAVSLVALAASWWPARRAIASNPLDTLRRE